MRGELNTGPHDARSEQQDQADALAAFGISADTSGADPEPPFYLATSEVPALLLWFDLQTQWRVGMQGPTGLDYAAVESVMRIRGLRPRAQRERLWQIQALERGALQGWAEQRDKG